MAWLDRRGHLQLRRSTVHIDAAVPSLIQLEPTRVTNIFVPTGQDIAVALLLHPEQTHRPTEVAMLIGRSPGGYRRSWPRCGIVASWTAKVGRRSPTCSTKWSTPGLRPI